MKQNKKFRLKFGYNNFLKAVNNVWPYQSCTNFALYYSKTEGWWSDVTPEDGYNIGSDEIIVEKFVIWECSGRTISPTQSSYRKLRQEIFDIFDSTYGGF